MSHREEPCPFRIVEDFGSGFSMGCVGGCLLYFIRGAWRGGGVGNSKWASGLTLLKQRAPILGGSFAMWAGIFSLTECTMVGIRNKEDWINQVGAGAFTGGFLAFRSGWAAASRSAITGGLLLGCICIVEQIFIKFGRQKELEMQAEMAKREIEVQRKEIAKVRPDLFVEQGGFLVPRTATARFA